MYESFFRLTETPFSIAPNPHYLYLSQQHKEALAHLIYGVGRDGGVVLLTGEVGTGKTTVCRCFLEQIPEDTDVAFLLNPKVQVEELLATICDELSIPYIGDSITIKDYIDCINAFLLRQHASGRHTVLIIDEAQNLNPDVLEQVRLLTNLETHEKKLLQIVLLGQPELQEMFAQPELRQLSQRVTARCHLQALRLEEVGPYVHHRLTVAGSIHPEAIFPEATIKRLHQITKGIPRVINLICDRAMLGAYARETRTVDPDLLGHAATEVLGYEVHTPAEALKRKWGLPAAIGVGAGVLCTLLLMLVLGKQQSGDPVADDQQAASAASAAPANAAPITTPAVAAVPTSAVTPPPASVLQAAVPAADAGAQFVEGEGDSFAELDMYTVDELMRESTNETEQQAFVELFDSWGVDYNPRRQADPCKYAEGRELSCLQRQGSLGSIKHLGMPVILKLYGSAGHVRYVVLRSLSNLIGEIYINGELASVDLATLDNHWRGDFTLLWKKPEQYIGPLHPGTIAPLSKWLAYQLDVWEKKAEPRMGRSSYDEALQERVRDFQRQVGEIPDGIVGAATLIQLTRRVDKAVPLLQDGAEGS